MVTLLQHLWHHITSRRKKQLVFIMMLMLITSVAEVVSIGAVIPFLSVLANPEEVFHHEYAQILISYIEISEPDQLLLPFTAAFATAALIAGIMRIALLWGQTRLGHAIGADISFQIYQRTLYQPYSVHVARNSSEIIAAISTKADQVVYQTFLPVLYLLSSVFMLIMILATLIVIHPVMATSTMVGFAAIYGLFVLLTRYRLIENSQRISQKSNLIIKALQEGLGGVRDVLIDGTQDTYCQTFRSADISRRRATADNQLMGLSPRYGVESLGMVLISVLAFYLQDTEGTLVSVLPLLGALVIGAQRMLPMLQQAYSAWTSMRGGKVILQDALTLLDQPLPEYAEGPTKSPIPFQQSIKLERMAFRYRDDAPWVLTEIDLKIPKGSNIGFIGITGSGKSTVLDIIMALLHPTNGRLTVDGVTITEKNYRSWQSHIAHIPQAIFLSDATIAENIAFGLPKEQIDYKMVEKSAKQAQIHDTIITWDNQYNTEVGERGVRLSGGQRQRIGIARALYKQANVLILDEATSALDNTTEKTVMDAIHDTHKDITILMVAHRLSTLQGCDQIIELENGTIKQQGTPAEMINTST